MLNPDEKNVLRRLAAEYMEYALLPVQAEKKRLWRALNRSKPERPMVLIDQLPWNELAVDESLKCVVSDPFWTGVERELRQTLYKWRNFPVDMVLDPFISLPICAYNTHFGLFAQVEKRGEIGTTAYSQHYKRLINNYDDINKILDMKILYDEEKTAKRFDEARELFDGIAEVKMHGLDFHLGIWDYISSIIGVEDIYFLMFDEPEFLHAVVNRCCEATIAGIEQANALKVHNDIANLCHCSHIFTDELLPDSGMGKGRVSQNCWCLGLAQLFTAVSPEAFAEFEMPYISKMASYFGMIYYGCCDRMDDRLDYVKKIPNVKKVSCSPWSDRKNFAENIGSELIMSNKPTPAYVAATKFDEDIIRKDLQYTYELAKSNGVCLEYILKDVSTVCKEPQRLNQWAKIAMEVVES